jgi:hypothetical protein
LQIVTSLYSLSIVVVNLVVGIRLLQRLIPTY